MAYQGSLTIDGVIRLDQFWPRGKSDGDTVTITLAAGVKPFRFRKSPRASSAVTTALDQALSQDSKTFNQNSATRVVHNMRGKANAGSRYVKVRLQGIDAPELHYKLYDGRQVKKLVNKKANIEYYQPLGPSAALVLKRLIEAVGTSSELPSQFRTRVDLPEQVADKYGRLVGDIFVKVGGSEINLNNAMLEQGLALAAFYDSMRADEIREKIAAEQVGAKVPNRLDRYYRKKVGALNKKLQYVKLTTQAKQKPPTIGQDGGAVVLPNLFRRLCAWTILNDGKVPKTPTKFANYVKADKSIERILFTREFLEGKRTLHDFLPHFRGNTLSLAAEEMVFTEAPSFLFHPEGTPVSKW